MTPFDLAQRFIGEIKELPGVQEHPFIQFAHLLCGLRIRAFVEDKVG